MSRTAIAVVVVCLAVGLVLRGLSAEEKIGQFKADDARIDRIILDAIPELNRLAGHDVGASAGSGTWFARTRSTGNSASRVMTHPWDVGNVWTEWDVVARAPSDDGSGLPHVHLRVGWRMGNWLWPTSGSLSVSETGRPNDGAARALITERLEAAGFKLQ